MATRLSLAISAVFVLSFGLGCSSEDSSTKDIFSADEDGKRRHKATNEERLWTVYLGGCSGSLLSPDLLLTASHCSPSVGSRYTSGSAMNRGEKGDLTAVAIVENSSFLDYAIVRVQWKGGAKPKDQQFPPSVATQAGDVSMGTGAGQGDEIYTVGFPGDKASTWGATYAEGQLKRTSGNNLQYNMGIINGNSGGAVWRKKDRMLVSLTNGGPTVLNGAGWNNNDVNDGSHWNHGAAMWKIYAQSKALQDVFPGGKNRFALNETAADAYLAVVDEGNDTFLWASVPEGTTAALCEGKAPEACTSGDFELAQRKAFGGRAFYRTTRSVSVKDRMSLTVVGLDAGGQIKAANRLTVRDAQAAEAETLNVGAAPSNYMSLGTVRSTLKTWAALSPSLMETGSVGPAGAAFLRVSKAVKTGEKLPKVLVTAATHGDEAISTATVVGMMHRILSRAGQDPEIDRLLATRDLYFVPVVCTEGYENNSREVEGRDPNRSFASPVNPDRVPTRCSQDMAAFFEKHRFAGTLDYHASGRLMMYPWSHKSSPVDDVNHDRGFRALAKRMADLAGYQWGQIPSLIGSLAEGSSGDFYYWKGQELGFTTCAMAVEVSTAKRPAAGSIAPEVDLNFGALMTFLQESPTVLTKTSAQVADAYGDADPEVPVYANLSPWVIEGLE